jgi:hypothetical protein
MGYRNSDCGEERIAVLCETLCSSLCTLWFGFKMHLILSADRQAQQAAEGRFFSVY